MKLNKIHELYLDQKSNNEHRIEMKNNILYLYKGDYPVMYDKDSVIKLYEDSILGEVKGDILIVGLGYGFLHTNFNSLTEVTSITTLELEQDLIDLVNPVMSFINYIQGDAFTYDTDVVYDYIFLDIFSDKVFDYEVKQKQLIDKYSKNVKNDNIDYFKIHNINI